MRIYKKIVCGVIGGGYWGEKMINHIMKSERFEIEMIYDILVDRSQYIAKKYKCKTAYSINELMENKKIECIFIFSPNNYHVSQSIAAAKSKKHIFLEKPIANTSKEGLEIFKACYENGVILNVGHNVKYYSIFQEMKNIIKNNKLGEIVYIDGHRSRPIGVNINEESWRFYKNSCNGGPLIQMGIHIIDTVRFLVGLDVEKIYSISTKNFLKTENHESYSIILKTKSGYQFHMFTSYVLPESFYINIFGTHGILFADVFNGLYFQDKYSTNRRKIVYKKNKPEIMEIIDFYNMIGNQKNYSNHYVEAAIDNVKIIEKIVSSQKH